MASREAGWRAEHGFLREELQQELHRERERHKLQLSKLSAEIESWCVRAEPFCDPGVVNPQGGPAYPRATVREKATYGTTEQHDNDCTSYYPVSAISMGPRVQHRIRIMQESGIRLIGMKWSCRRQQHEEMKLERDNEAAEKQAMADLHVKVSGGDTVNVLPCHAR